MEKLVRLGGDIKYIGYDGFGVLEGWWRIDGVELGKFETIVF